MIEIRGGVTQNDLAGSLTNLMINWLHMRECWSVGAILIVDFGIWIADLEWRRLKARLISLLLNLKSKIQITIISQTAKTVCRQTFHLSSSLTRIRVSSTLWDSIRKNNFPTNAKTGLIERSRSPVIFTLALFSSVI